MGRNPQKALMAGDSEVDAITAREAGVTFIGLTTGGRARCDLFAEGALEVLDELAELPGLIAFPTEGVS
jgi:phosphoglycolate phosphatase-like HAD superfamily hydrolase